MHQEVKSLLEARGAEQGWGCMGAIKGSRAEEQAWMLDLDFSYDESELPGHLA